MFTRNEQLCQKYDLRSWSRLGGHFPIAIYFCIHIICTFYSFLLHFNDFPFCNENFDSNFISCMPQCYSSACWSLKFWYHVSRTIYGRITAHIYCCICKCIQLYSSFTHFYSILTIFHSALQKKNRKNLN